MTFNAIHRRLPGAALTAAMFALAIFTLILAVLIPGGFAGPAVAAEEKDPWPELARDVFNGRVIADGR
jgi:hypothetical protein